MADIAASVLTRLKNMALLLPVQVDAPERILQRFAAHRHLVGELLFGYSRKKRYLCNLNN